MDLLFLDFEKAFDKVDHGILCHRLKEKGISNNTGKWIYDFLKDRFQIVVANGKMSRREPITSGVPQGSVLGPILFLLLIDSIGDIDQNITMACFADDSKLFHSINSIEDAEYFQYCIEKLDNWQKVNNMSFNNGKFQLIQYGKNLNMRSDYNYLSPDYSAVIGPSTVVRDLGVQVNSSLNFSDHIEYIYKKAKQRINMVLQTFSNRSSIFMKFYWKTYVQPILDYASQVWAPIEGGLLY